MTSGGSMNGVDEFDLILIRELEPDGRQSYSALAAKLGASSMTVRRRMNRLLDEGTIRLETIPNPRAFGYGTRVALGVNVLQGKINLVIEHLVSARNIQHVATCSGRYNIIAFGAFKGNDDLLDFLTEDLGNVPNVTATEVMLFLKTPKVSLLNYGFEYGSVEQTDNYELDELDMVLTRELQKTPRISIKDLSFRLNISSSSTFRKLNRLTAMGFLKVVAVPNFYALGYLQTAVMLLNVQPNCIRSVATALRQSEIKQVHIVLGRFDVLLGGVFKDNREMSRFLNDELGSLPGILSFETLTDIRRHSYSWALL